jgi:hypothetical protein
MLLAVLSMDNDKTRELVMNMVHGQRKASHRKVTPNGHSKEHRRNHWEINSTIIFMMFGLSIEIRSSVT